MTRRNIGNSFVMGKVPGHLEQIEAAAWSRLERLNREIRPTLAHPFSQKMAEQIASEIGVHWVTVYRYRQRLLAADIATAIVGRKRGFPTGSSRLSPAHEAVIEKVIARLGRGTKKLRLIDVIDAIAQRCRSEGLSTPTRSSTSLAAK
jgi:putative transposase